MKKRIVKYFLPFLWGLSIGCIQNESTEKDTWAFKPFIKADAVNPVITPRHSTEFFCPVRGTKVKWEEKDVFNPAAVVKDGKIFLLYRAEDTVGRHAGTSRIGLAVSEDGFNFTRFDEPVLYPDNDDFKRLEWEGGCEDPRIVEDEGGTYYMTYTAYDGHTARLCIATSSDLQHWTKHGSVFKNAGENYAEMWSKAGSIVCRLKGEKLIATQINHYYWMYFGESNIYLAYSKDLIEWTPVRASEVLSTDEAFGHSRDKRILKPVLSPRRRFFDSRLVEPGPPAVITQHGILLIYNSSNSRLLGDPNLPYGTYAAGQALFKVGEPETIINRLQSTFFKPEKPYEITGQVNNVCFLQGLVFFKGKWLLYYGTADSKIAVATYSPEK